MPDMLDRWAGRDSAFSEGAQRLFDPPDKALGERRLARGDLVKVGAGNGIVTSVKTRRRFHALEHGDRGRQPVVQLAQDAGRRQLAVQCAYLQMRHLTHSMLS